MKKQFLAVISMSAVLILTGNVYAAQNSQGSTGNQVQQQTQVVNQGVTTQVQTETNNQIQSGNNVNQGDSGNGLQAQEQLQEQTQEQLQDGTGSGNQVQNQNQVNNTQSGQDGNGIQAQFGSEDAQQRRSQVSNAVQEMLQVAERNGGIGEQIRIIAQAQNQNQVRIEESLEKVQNRSGFVKFFVGPNYGEIKNTAKIVEQNREQIQQLNQTMSQITNQADQQVLAEQIQVIEQANLAIENALRESQKGFSLFGWAFRLFSR